MPFPEIFNRGFAVLLREKGKPSEEGLLYFLGKGLLLSTPNLSALLTKLYRAPWSVTKPGQSALVLDLKVIAQ
jgi:hypothetical protein